jgi:hypothetical protein
MDYQEEDIYIRIGKLMHENILIYEFNNDYIIINSKSYDEYKNEYINKLNMQIELLENSLNKTTLEIEELERKNLELFTKITKNLNINKNHNNNSYFRFNIKTSNKSLFFNFNFKNSLDNEKYNLNLLTINKLKSDKDTIYESLEKTKQYKSKYDK